MKTGGLEKRREELRARRELPEQDRRREATEATLAKFRGTAFDWSEGRHCMKLAHYHMRQMGKRPPALPRIRSAMAARRELKARGHETVTELLDGLLDRIPPARMQLGDLATLPGDDGLDAVFVCAGPRRLFGWREDHPVAVMLAIGLNEVTAAWSVRG
jgi:hypothetical protein